MAGQVISKRECQEIERALDDTGTDSPRNGSIAQHGKRLSRVRAAKIRKATAILSLGLWEKLKKRAPTYLRMLSGTNSKI